MKGVESTMSKGKKKLFVRMFVVGFQKYEILLINCVFTKTPKVGINRTQTEP